MPVGIFQVGVSPQILLVFYDLNASFLSSYSGYQETKQQCRNTFEGKVPPGNPTVKANILPLHSPKSPVPILHLL